MTAGTPRWTSWSSCSGTFVADGATNRVTMTFRLALSESVFGLLVVVASG